MFGLGAGEILVILFMALIFIGPKKLPELARSLGKGIREFQKAKDDLLHHMNSEDEAADHPEANVAVEHQDTSSTPVVEDYDASAAGEICEERLTEDGLNNDEIHQEVSAVHDHQAEASPEIEKAQEQEDDSSNDSTPKKPA